MKLKLRIIASLIVFIPFLIFGQLGAIDTTFNVLDDGPSQIYFDSPSQLYDSQVFSDGSIITVGEFTSYKNQPANRIVRFDFDSNLDQSFQSNIGSGADSAIKHILVLQNGKIFLAGDFSNFNGIPSNGSILLNADGTIDSGYSSTVNTGIIGFRSLVEQNSKILISGHTSLSPITSTLIRIDQFGSVDPSFSASVPIGNTPNYGEVNVDSQGRIYLNGSFDDMDGHPTAKFARLLTDGSVDVSFSCQNFSYGFFTHDIDLNDQVVLRDLNELVRLKDNGSIDTTFNPTGVFSTSGVGVITEIRSMPDSTYFIVTSNSRVFKLNSQGQSSTDFLHLEDPGGYARDLNIFPSGKLLITRPNNLFVLQANGWRDAAFQTNMGATGKITAVKALPDGKALIAGNFYGYNNENIQTIARILSDGNLDPSFDSGVTLRQSSFTSNIWSIAPQSDGKILIGGNFPTYEAGVSLPTGREVIRLLPNGERDTTFNEISSSGAFGSLELIVLGDGSFFSIGQSTVRKYNADGQVDNGFNIIGVSGLGGTIHDAHILPTGKLLVGGLFSDVNGVSANSLVRINPDGTIDNTFSSGSGTAIYAINSQSDGKVLLSGLGYTGGYNGFNFGYLFRIHENGDFDTTFVLDSIYSTGNIGTIPKISVTTDDKIWVVANLGSTSMFQSSGGGVIRLDTNGVFDTSQVVFPTIYSSSDIKFDIQPSNNIIIGGWFGNYGFVDRHNLTRIIGDTSSPNCQFFGADFDYIDDLSCADTSNSVALGINGTPPYLYSWDNQGWNQNDTLFTTSNGGTHFLSISDSVGCSYSTGFLINGPSNQVAPDNFVNMIAWSFHPGFNTNVKINAGNKGCILSSGQLTVVYDSLLSFNFANPFMPDSIQGDTLIWNFQDLHIDSTDLLFTLNFQTSVNAQIGDSINFQLEIDSLGIDYNVSSSKNLNSTKSPS